MNPLSFLSFFNTQLYIILNVINQHEDYENIVNQLVWHQGNENNCNNFYFYHLVNQNLKKIITWITKSGLDKKVTFFTFF